MKTDKQIKQILVDNLSPSPVAWVGGNTDINNLSINEIEKLVAITTSQRKWIFDNRTKDFVEWCLQTIQTKQLEKSTELLTIEQLGIFGVPSGQCDIFGNDLY